MAKDPKTAIEGEIQDALTTQKELDKLESELLQLPAFQRFIQLRNAVDEKYKAVRKDIEAVMVPAYKAGQIDKSIKGAWGTITVTEGDKFKINESELPAKFFKKIPDEAKIRATFQLEGKAPKGTEHYKKYGIMMKLEGASNV